MTTNSGSERSLAGRPGWLVVAIIVLGSVAFVAWLFLGGGTWRTEVSVIEADLRSANRLALIVDSCNGDPEVSVLRETDQHVQVEVVASSTPFQGGDDCLDVVEVELQEPLKDRTVIDLHSGEEVPVSKIDSLSG
jgi:hypothetical protein